jgi:hypothetical protein
MYGSFERCDGQHDVHQHDDISKVGVFSTTIYHDDRNQHQQSNHQRNEHPQNEHPQNEHRHNEHQHDKKPPSFKVTEQLTRSALTTSMPVQSAINIRNNILYDTTNHLHNVRQPKDMPSPLSTLCSQRHICKYIKGDNPSRNGRNQQSVNLQHGVSCDTRSSLIGQ